MLERWLIAAAFLIASCAASAQTLKPGHVLGNGTAAERTPTDISIIDVLSHAGTIPSLTVGNLTSTTVNEQISPTGTLIAPPLLNNALGGFFYQPSFNAASTTSPGAHIPTLLDAEAIIGGSAMNDGYNAMGSFLEMTTPSSPSNTYRFYASQFGFAQATVDDNGTNMAPEGNLYGDASVARLIGTAAHWKGLFPADFEESNEAGSAQYQAVIALGTWPAHAYSGTTVDTYIYGFAGAGAHATTNFIEVDDEFGAGSFPISGSFIKAQRGTMTNGIDFDDMTSMTNVMTWNTGTFGFSWAGHATLGAAVFYAPSATNPVDIGTWKGTYGAVSFNTSFTDGAMTGCAGSGAADDALYCVSTHAIILRPNGVTVNSTGYTFATTALTMPAGLTGGAAAKYVCADASHNWFESGSAC